MKPPATWGEFKERFTQNTEPLAAQRSSTDVRQEAMRLTALLNSRLESESKPTPDAAYGLARAAARAERVPTDERGRQWFFRGADSTVQMFRSIASRAARAANCVSLEADQEVATIAWLNVVCGRLGDARELDDENIQRARLSDVWSASARVCDLFDFEGKACLVASPLEHPTASPLDDVPQTDSLPRHRSPSTAARSVGDSDLLTIREASERLKCHPQTVRAMGRRGEIEILQFGPRRQRITLAEIERLEETAKFMYR
jgi:excisionase family DNA binding protein